MAVPAGAQVGLSDVCEHLRCILPDPEAAPPLRQEDGEASQATNGDRAAASGRPGPAIEAVEQSSGAAAGEPGVWVPPEEFQRKSTKFWARPSAIPAIQARAVCSGPPLG